jgi:hypothetical protein
LPAALSAIGIRVFEVLSPLRLFSPLECGTADYLLWSIIALLTIMIARVLWRIPHDRPTGDYLAQFQLWWKRKTAHEHREE